MAAYAYKDVYFREDFTAAIAEWEAQEGAGTFDGDFNYDGDGWYVAAFLLDKKDAEIARLRALVPSTTEEKQP